MSVEISPLDMLIIQLLLPYYTSIPKQQITVRYVSLALSIIYLGDIYLVTGLIHIKIYKNGPKFSV